MTKRVLLLSTLTLLLAPSLAFAAPSSNSKFWELTSVASSRAEIETEISSLWAQLSKVERDARMAKRTYLKSTEGLRAEVARIQREREVLESAIDTASEIERKLIGLINVQGAPHNHLKRWAAQRRQRDAEMLLSLDKQAAFEDLERREALLAEEIAEFNRGYDDVKTYFDNKAERIQGEIDQLKSSLVATDTDRRDFFFDYVNTPAKMSKLEQRRAEAAAAKARRDARLKQAMLRAEFNHYLNRSQPEVEQMLYNDLMQSQDHQRAMIWKQIDESLGSNVSFEELKRMYLNWFVESEAN